MNLVEALNPNLPARIAIVGAGGKTTTLFQLGRQIEGLTWTTTTTHLGTDQLSYADRHFVVETPAQLDLHQLLAQKHSLITGPFTPDDRVHGPSPEVMEQLVKLANAQQVSLIVEADGARSHPLKAPAEHEPVIPDWVDTVIVLVGCSVFGRPLTQDWVHRTEIFSSLTGLQINDPIRPADVTRMLVHPLGGLKGIPATAKKVVLFNQADVLSETETLKKEIPALHSAGYDSVIIGALSKYPEDLFRSIK